jgi:histidine triad (HIT) family protein
VSDASDCIFCKIVRGEIPGRIIDENADVMAFLSLENHPLIVTRDHLVDILSLTNKQGAAVMSEAIRIAKAMYEAIKPDGIQVTQSNGAAAGQDVFHYHMHLYPRWNDTRVPHADDASKDRMLQSLKAALAKI